MRLVECRWRLRLARPPLAGAPVGKQSAIDTAIRDLPDTPFPPASALAPDGRSLIGGRWGMDRCGRGSDPGPPRGQGHCFREALPHFVHGQGFSLNGTPSLALLALEEEEGTTGSTTMWAFVFCHVAAFGRWGTL